jgi:GTP cyclohydrolase I
MDKEKIEKAVKMILEAIGEDPQREGIKETPRRVAKMYEEIFQGLKEDPKKVLKVFTHEEHDEIVLIKEIPFYSVCEHHLLPFVGKAHIAYIPKENRVTGLSKLARVIDILSKRPQTQERLTRVVADTVMEVLRPRGVLVIIEAEHLCMSMRGIKKAGALTVTSAVRGIFKENEKTRAETLSLIKG